MKLFRAQPEEYYDAPFASFPLACRVFLAIAKALILLWSKIYWHWTCDGPNPFEHRDPEGKGRVIIANHASMLDPCLLISLSLGKGVAIRPIFKDEFLKSGFLRWFFARIGGIPVKRGTADVKSIRRAVNAIKRGEDVLIFPEGTRIWDPHARPELYGGFSFIAQMAHCDVVPVAIDGAELINPNKQHRIVRPARVRVRFGEPVSIDSVQAPTRKEQSEELERMSMGLVYAMRDALRRENGKD